MPVTLTDNRKRAASPPAQNKIVASDGLPKNAAPAGLGTKATAPQGARPPAQKSPSRALLKQLEEPAPFPGDFEAQCFWVLARHDLAEAKKWAGDEPGAVKVFERCLTEYRAAGRPVGFLSEASTDPDEDGTDAEAAAAHADPEPARVPTLNEVVEAWFRDGLGEALALGATIDIDKMYAKAQEMNPSLYAKCIERDQNAQQATRDADRIAAEVDEAMASKRYDPGVAEMEGADIVVNAEAAKRNAAIDAAKGNKKRWSAVKREKAQKMLHEGASIEVVAEAVDMPAESVQAYALELSQMAGAPAPAAPVETQTAQAQPAAPAAPAPEVFRTQVRVGVKLDPLAPPSAELLSSVLQVKNEHRWDEPGTGAALPARSADELVTYFEERLHAARWLKQNGVK